MNPVAKRFNPQDLFFPSGDGETLHGWFFSSNEPKGTVLVFHGNAENISTHVNTVLWLVPAGFNLFIIDYRGYGLSTGKPSLDGIHRDGLASLERLLSLKEAGRGLVILLGQSLGASVATYVAATSPYRTEVKSLVLDSAFSGYRQIVREKLAESLFTWPFQYPLSWLVNDDYSAFQWIGHVTAPVVIIHDRGDKIVPFCHSQQLKAGVRGEVALLETEGYGHVGSFADASIRHRLAGILESAVKDRLPEPRAPDSLPQKRGDGFPMD